MQEIIAYCGLPCNECESFIATMNNDEEEINRIAAEWSEKYGSKITPVDVWCEGCLTTTGRQSSYCRSHCQVKKCAVEKQVVNCGHCADFVCGTLEEFYKMGIDTPEFAEKISAARKRMEKVHSRI